MFWKIFLKEENELPVVSIRSLETSKCSITSVLIAFTSASFSWLVTDFDISNAATCPAKDGEELGSALVIGCVVGLAVTNATQNTIVLSKRNP